MTRNQSYLGRSKWQSVRTALLAILVACCVNALLVVLIHRLKTTDTAEPDKYRLRKVKFEKQPSRVLRPPKPAPKKKKKKKKKKKPKLVRKRIVKKPPPVDPLKLQQTPLSIDMRMRTLNNLRTVTVPPPTPEPEPMPEPEPEVVEEPEEDEPGIYEVEMVDQPPKPIRRNPPIYPSSAKRLGLEGWVDIEFVVDEGGAVTTVDVINSSSRRFHQSAVSAVYSWQFEPAVMNQTEVAVLCRQKLKFSLQK